MSKTKRMRSALTACITSVSFAALLTGCSITQMPSAGTGALHEDNGQHPADAQHDLLQEAFDKMAGLQSFGIKAFSATSANSFTKNASYYGHVVKPDQFSLNEAIDGKSFMVTQTATDTYVRAEDKWAPIPRITKSFDVFGSLQTVPKAAQHVSQLKDDTVISTPTYVLQFDTDTKTLAGLQNFAFDTNSLDAKGYPIRYTVWIGKKDHLIYRMQMQWTHDEPTIGNVGETTSLLFFDLGANVPITLPDMKDQTTQSESQTTPTP